MGVSDINVFTLRGEGQERVRGRGKSKDCSRGSQRKIPREIIWQSPCDVVTLAVWATDHAQSVCICSNTVKTGEA